MAKRKEPSKPKSPTIAKTPSPSRSSTRKPVLPAFGAGKLLDRAFGAPAEQFGQELDRLRTGERAARVIDWVIRSVEATPKIAKFIREFVAKDVLPRLRHVDPTSWVRPKTLLLEPALAGARKCREEPELRKLFARLLASAMDPSTYALVHPAFAPTFDQMAPLDAVVLEFIFAKGNSLDPAGGSPSSVPSVPSLEAVWLIPERPDKGYIHKYRNFIGYPELEGLDVEAVQISISNLERLGIVETQMGRMLDQPEAYASLTESEFGRNFIAAAQKSGYSAEFRRQILALTPFGLRLCTLCIAETDQSGTVGVSPAGGK
jgi:Abortive infection alpha